MLNTSLLPTCSFAIAFDVHRVAAALLRHAAINMGIIGKNCKPIELL